jgi:hypothetical protein
MRPNHPFPQKAGFRRAAAFRIVFGATLASAGFAPGASAANSATLTVNAGQTVRIVDNRMPGLNTAVWDNYSETLGNSYVVTLLQATNVGSMRYPGGSTSDTFHWQTDSIEGTVGSSTIPDPTNMSDQSSYGTSFDEFAALAHKLNSQPFITANYGSGTPAEAAAWVQYSNVSPNKYGFKYWEIGNECYGGWEVDGNTPAHDAVEYATRFAQYYQAMKAVDPTIKLGMPASPNEDDYANTAEPAVTNPRTNTVHYGWVPQVLTTLKSLGVTPDFLIFHYYPINTLSAENDANLLQASSAGVLTENPMYPVSTYAAEMRQQLSDYLPGAGANVELVCTETNNEAGPPLGKQSTSIVDGLFMADTVGSFLQTEFNAMVWWDSFNGQSGPSDGGNFSSSVYGWRMVGDEGIMYTDGGTYPTYYIFKLLGDFVHGGDSVVKASSSSTLLSVYAAKRQNGSLTLLVINKDPTNTWTGNISLSGYSPLGSATEYVYGKQQDLAAQTSPGDAVADVQQSTMTGISTNFSATFGPYSATVIAMAAPNPVITSSPVGETVATGSTVVLTAVASNATSYQWTLNGTTVLGDSASGTTTDVIAGSSGPQLVITNATAASNGSYTVVAINSNGSSQPSTPATLTVTSTSNPGYLINISARAFVGTGGNIMIGGFYIVGSTSRSVLIQAIGPGLAGEGVTGVLQHPALSIHNSAGATIYSNTGWGSSQLLLNAAAAAYANPVLQANSADSELLLTLPPGGYTAEVAGGDGGTGVALCAIYQLP